MKPTPALNVTIVISLLRGVNVGGHNQIKMDTLRALYEALGLEDPKTYVQSGNVVFGTKERNLAGLAGRLENAIERKFSFRPAVVLRTSADLKDVLATNPFAKRHGLEPDKLAVVFFNEPPTKEACDEVLRVKTEGEEVQIRGREFYIYFPNGMGQSKLFAAIGRQLKSGTVRNWNTVTKLFEIAKKLEAGC
ncbi:MAG TPA: DUF1697 domain-containing protein [Terriglobales bacterium]|nr:DUF1697 domain-containing protein [Terriglobales bacterium]